MRRLILYSADGCHLCDEARDLLSGLLSDAPDVELAEVDIGSDDELHRRMLERIPVIELDGEVVSELVPDSNALRALLLQTAPG